MPSDQAAKVLEPCEQPLDLPPLSVSSQWATILGWRATATGAVRRNHFNATLSEYSLVGWVTFIGAVANELVRSVFKK